MEFAVALVSAVATAAASKLTTVIGKLSSGTDASDDAIFIRDELTFIDPCIKHNTNKGLLGHVSIMQEPCIAQLRRLAYEIEDSIDCFEAKKTTLKDFATEIRKLKSRSTETRRRIMDYLKIANGAAVGTEQGAAVVPRELQDLFDDPSRQVWLAENFDCLLYFCLFPPNHHVSTKPLVRRWLAEGLVQGDNVAAENLEILITASIISSTQTSNNGDVEICRPTGEMHACISQKSKSQNFVLVFDGSTSKLKLAADARRLSVHPSANVQLNLTPNLSRLRTLAVFSDSAANLASSEAVLDFTRYGMLRVLDLKECAHLSEEHLRDIWGQVLMKYLSMNLGSIGRIERKIGCLNQLETLDLSGSQTVTVYKEVLLLPKLKHLLGKFQLSRRDAPSVPLVGWFESGLEKFLSDKSVLETLEGFVTGKRYGFPQLMSLMRRLRKVKIWCKSDASQRNLSDISSAITKFIRDGTNEPDLSRSLSMDFEACSREFVNEIVPVAAGIFNSLELCGRLSQFPPFVAGLSDIKELCLCSTGLSWEIILAGLLSVGGLQYLKLIEDNLGRIEIQPAHLRSIERICVVFVQMIDIAIQADAMPHLVSLHILCQDLDVIPGTTSIEITHMTFLKKKKKEITHMTRLKEIALHHLVAGGIKTRWQEAVDGHTNRPVPVLLSIEGP